MNFWEKNMERFDVNDGFFRLVKQPDRDYISRDNLLTLHRGSFHAVDEEEDIIKITEDLIKYGEHSL